MLETKETLEFDSWPNLMRTHANLAKWYYSIYSIRKKCFNITKFIHKATYIYVNICDINFIYIFFFLLRIISVFTHFYEYFSRGKIIYYFSYWWILGPMLIRH